MPTITRSGIPQISDRRWPPVDNDESSGICLLNGDFCLRIRIPWDENHHLNHHIWGKNMFFPINLSSKSESFQLANLRIDVKGALKITPLEEKALRSKPKLTRHQNPRYDWWLHEKCRKHPVCNPEFFCMYFCMYVFLVFFSIALYYIFFSYYVYLSQNIWKNVINIFWGVVCFS